MKKNKDGKVIASLTEVKNKTGDIFAVVDEYGEIILTSYNKPRYKVIKIDLEESLQFNDTKEKTASTKKKIQKNNIQPQPTAPNIPSTNQIESIKTQPKAQETNKAKDAEENDNIISNLEPWNSENTTEITFIQEIIRPIQ